MWTLNSCYQRSGFILLVSLIWGGCVLLSKPDTCECSGCPLNASETPSQIELAPLPSNSPNSKREVEICACRPWNPSGIMVATGQEYHFEIIRDNEMESWDDGSLNATPENGWTGNLANLVGYLAGFLKRSDKANWYALIGTIGESDQDSFAISPKSVVMAKGGELVFYANDMQGRYFNNRGFIKLNVTRIK